MKKYNIPSKYRLCAISKAAGILASRKKSVKRGYFTKDPYVKNPILLSCYSFKIVKDKFRIPIGKRQYEFIPLNKYTMRILQDQSLKVRSFVLTETSISICIAREAKETDDLTGTIGIDRKVENLCVSNQESATYYDMTKVVEIGETTKEIIKSFERNDVRIRRQIYSKYGKRKAERVKLILHVISKDVVKKAMENKKAIVFEDIRNIRSMYRKGNWQGTDFRRQMNNHWPYGEIEREIEYKAAWEGVPAIHLTKGETRGTSLDCVICGERLQEPFKNDVQHRRQLWCKKCQRWLDRDQVAVMNISHRGWVRFAHSEGVGGEAMVAEPERTIVIRKVDPTKLNSLGNKV